MQKVIKTHHLLYLKTGTKNININNKTVKQKYQINGICCRGCVARVKKTLGEHPNIEKA